MESFTDRAVRIGFIRKVYGIVSVQLTVTFAVLAFFMFYVAGERCTNQEPGCRPLPPHQTENWLIVCGVSGLMGLVILIPIVCCTHLRTKTPINYILLGAFTLCESLSLGTVGLVYTADSIIIAAGITLGLVIFLTIFAFQTKIDFTACRGVMFCILLVFTICGLIMIFIPYNRILEIVYAGIGAIIFSVYLIIDTQLMMGGQHKFSISPEEYVFAAICIYLDILNLFLYIYLHEH